MCPVSPTLQSAPAEQELAEVRAGTAGLTSREARRRLAEFGPNELTSAHRSRTVVEIVLLFANPLSIILLIAGLASALLGEVINAVIIVAMVLMSVALNFFQTYRSGRAAERLRERVAPTAIVRRDGGWAEIPRRQVVPGDAKPPHLGFGTEENNGSKVTPPIGQFVLSSCD